MGYITIGTESHDFLSSEEGLNPVTYTFDASNSNVVEVDTKCGKRKMLLAGTIYPSNDGDVEGIVYDTVDVTDGNISGSLIVGGRVVDGKCLVNGVKTKFNALATTKLASKGVFVDTLGDFKYQNESAE